MRTNYVSDAEPSILRKGYMAVASTGDRILFGHPMTGTLGVPGGITGGLYRAITFVEEVVDAMAVSWRNRV